ncbi:taste receptor type 2 member 5 [Echinops telfairi]|uniref:Taste receptor type 2 n=1 Tax=Echinops telfairi TaxID=9371 RepID=A0ABM0J3M1_ECHTE|nr:taste receptor type 2 member 5 [Echinops telfairi]
MEIPLTRLTFPQGLLIVVAGAEFLVGLLGNGVLVVWSLKEWARRANLTPYSGIILGLAASRFLLQWLIMADLALFPSFQGSWQLYILSLVWVPVSQASVWFTTFLSVFYCLKIATFEYPAYVWLKRQAYHLSLWCLLGYCILTLILVDHIIRQAYVLFKSNSSIPHSPIGQHYGYLTLLNSGSWLPFLLFLLYSGMLMASLYRHHRKMQVFKAGRRDAQAQAHIMALKSLGCFLVLHIVYILASPFSITSKHPSPSLTSVLFFETLMAASPSLHSALLVLGNPRAKELWRRILQKVVGTCRDGGPCLEEMGAEGCVRHR